MASGTEAMSVWLNNDGRYVEAAREVWRENLTELDGVPTVTAAGEALGDWFEETLMGLFPTANDAQHNMLNQFLTVVNHTVDWAKVGEMISLSEEV
jgi:hypothetical protein